jgi:hypothetical protein
MTPRRRERFTVDAVDDVTQLQKIDRNTVANRESCRIMIL